MPRVARAAGRSVGDGDSTRTAVARWIGGWRCDVRSGDFQMVVDEPVQDGGEGAGPAPTDLLLAAVSSCYALALCWAARKRGIALADLSVEAAGTYDGARFAELVLTVTTSLPAERLEPLIEPAGRVCYVSNTIAHGAAVTVRVAPPAA
jgi:putative redox protein